jgi:alanine racemase
MGGRIEKGVDSVESTLRRTWAEIDLDALAHNYQALRRHIGPGVKFLGVVKGDAYGHGAVQVSRRLQELGADYLAVSSIDEAMELRLGGITMPILILGHTPAEQVGRLIEHHITQAVTNAAKAEEYSAAAARHGGTLRVHIKVDTGMSRLGFLCAGAHFDTGVAGICRTCALPGLEAEGIFTHFAVADEPDGDSAAYTRAQFELFRRVIAAAEARLGRRFPIRHCANTGAVARYGDTYLDMVRPGLLLYGCGPFAGELGLRPVMTLKTTVSTIKTYDPGTSVSYGRLFTTGRTTRMGVVPYGYADGFFRCLSNRCALMTAEGPAPQRGRICMDMAMIDLTDLPGVQVGDEVEVFGPHSPVDRLADLAGTVPYELLCAVSKRVPRVYLRGGAVTGRELLLRF